MAKITLSEAMKQGIEADLRAGMTHRAIKRKRGAPLATISRIRNGLHGSGAETTTELYAKLMDTFGWVKTYDDYPQIESDNLMVVSDIHLPYVNIKAAGFMFEKAIEYNTRECLVAGDFFDQSMFSIFQSSDKITWEQERSTAKRFLCLMLECFDKITFLLGNHDARILRSLDFLIKHSDVMRMVVDDERLFVSEYAHALVNQQIHKGNHWLVLHPKCYSRVAGQKAKRFAEKHHCNVISTHGHATCDTSDISGRYSCIDIGGLVDYDKTEYVSKRLTDHPRWVNGFVILKDNRPLLYKERDWVNEGQNHSSHI